MKKFLKRRRTKNRPEPGNPVELVDLSTWNGRSDEALTPISRPDSLSPVPHRIPAQDPEQADLRLLVTQIIADMHSRGALDGGHAAVLDHWIDGQLPGWLEVVEQQAMARRRTAEQLLAVDRENLTREALELADLRQEQLMLQAHNQHWRDVLTGNPSDPPRAATPEAVTQAPPMPALPDFRPSTYLDDHPPVPGAAGAEPDLEAGSDPDTGPTPLRAEG